MSMSLPLFLRVSTGILLAGFLSIGRGQGASLAQEATAGQVQPSAAASGCCGAITPGGEQLLKLLVSMDVEHLWMSHHKVEWRTGFPKSGRGGTHCSAFAAAVGERLGIYMLRPPEHSQEFLATAQGRWFEGEHARRDGWRQVRTAEEAQSLANRGELVVLFHISPEAEVHGHIAIVRPAVKSMSAMESEGPETMQAGLLNFADGTAKRSFQLHPGVWPSQVGMYAHATRFSDAALAE
jgi:hypothetical protein